MNPPPDDPPRDLELSQTAPLTAWTPRPEPAAPSPPSAQGQATDVGERLDDEDWAIEEAEAPLAEDSSAPALNDWKAALRRDFEQWLDALDAIPEASEAETDLDDASDLFSFHEQLATANVETRKANRRTAEAFSQWGETLSKFDADLRLLREQLARQPSVRDDALPRPWALAMVEMVDRLRRLAAAFASPPPRSWLGNDARWRKSWATQQQGFDILLSHVEALLKQAGVTRISALHEPFNPSTMAAVAAVTSATWPPQTVIEEVAAGYRLHDELLRVAQVKVSATKSPLTP